MPRYCSCSAFVEQFGTDCRRSPVLRRAPYSVLLLPTCACTHQPSCSGSSARGISERVLGFRSPDDRIYNQHGWLLSPGLGWLAPPKFTRGLEPILSRNQFGNFALFIRSSRADERYRDYRQLKPQGLPGSVGRAFEPAGSSPAAAIIACPNSSGEIAKGVPAPIAPASVCSAAVTGATKR